MCVYTVYVQSYMVVCQIFHMFKRNKLMKYNERLFLPVHNIVISVIAETTKFLDVCRFTKPTILLHVQDAMFYKAFVVTTNNKGYSRIKCMVGRAAHIISIPNMFPYIQY